jgi:hypothetical protein
MVLPKSGVASRANSRKPPPEISEGGTSDADREDIAVIEPRGTRFGRRTPPIPCLWGGADVTLAAGRLADIAPTLLDLTGLPKPAEMTGDSLLRPLVAHETLIAGIE